MPRGIYPRPEGYRPRKTDPPELVVRVKALYGANWSQLEIAKELGMSLRGVQGIFRRNAIPVRRQVKRDQRGAKNASWKGDQAGYQAMHLRVRTVRGAPTTCVVCGKPAREWATLTGKLQVIEDYAPMCRSCHRKHDGTIRNIRGTTKTANTA